MPTAELLHPTTSPTEVLCVVCHSTGQGCTSTICRGLDAD